MYKEILYNNEKLEVLIGHIVEKRQFAFALCCPGNSQKASSKLNAQYGINGHGYTRIVADNLKNTSLEDT